MKTLVYGKGVRRDGGESSEGLELRQHLPVARGQRARLSNSLNCRWSLNEGGDAGAGAAEGEGRAAVAREAEARVQRRHLPVPSEAIQRFDKWST